MKHKQISIVGSGWLGLPLAQHLQSKGYIIKSSTTSKEKIKSLADENFTSYCFKLGTEESDTILPDFTSNSGIIIINFPPKRKIEDIETVYPQQVEQLLNHINDTQKVIFISSTSVYQNTNTIVDERLSTIPEKASGKAVLNAENVLKTKLKERLTILRLSGLIGYERMPGRFLATKTNLKNGNAPINVIHRDDCIGLITAITEQNCWGEIINGCSDEHPLRSVFYTLAAENIGLTPPTFVKDEEQTIFKIISNTKSKELLKYSYKYPDPLKLI